MSSKMGSMKLAKIAVAAMVAGCGASAEGTVVVVPPPPPERTGGEAKPATTHRRVQHVAAPNKACCKGMNDCKGKGNCKTERNDCKGQNMCKGTGGCASGDCS